MTADKTLEQQTTTLTNKHKYVRLYLVPKKISKYWKDKMDNTPQYDQFLEEQRNADHAEALKIARKAKGVAKLATKMARKGDYYRDFSLPMRLDYDHDALTKAANAELSRSQPGTKVETYIVDSGSPVDGFYHTVELTHVDGQQVKLAAQQENEQ